GVFLARIQRLADLSILELVSQSRSGLDNTNLLLFSDEGCRPMIVEVNALNGCKDGESTDALVARYPAANYPQSQRAKDGGSSTRLPWLSPPADKQKEKARNDWPKDCDRSAQSC